MSEKIIENIDEAIAALTAARGLVLSLPAPAPQPVPTLPLKITLPREGTASLNNFYGTASRSGRDLVWFNFPVKNMRLYSRNGANISDRDGDGFDDHRCHKAIAPRLEAALREIFNTLGAERFVAEGWHVYSGCFNYRTKRGGSSLSTHSWGIAVDMNSAENPFLGKTTTFSEVAIDIMEKHGFLSGGRAWGKDWMHFQAAIPVISRGSYYAKHGLPKHIIAA